MALVARSDLAVADPPDADNDHTVLLDDPTTDPPLPTNAMEASQGFSRRAARVLKYVGCSSPAAGVFNSDFSTNLEGWAGDALEKLAYPGACDTSDSNLQTASGRFDAVDKALAALTVASGLELGTSVDTTKYGIYTVERTGDLDTGLKEFIPILYLFASEIPLSYNHLLDVMSEYVGGTTPIRGFAPNYIMDLGSNGYTSVAETENHTLLILSTQYLTNQLVNKRSPGTFNNSQLHDELMAFLQGILQTDFFEYNSRPYTHYALYAMENLADFATDNDVATAARMVLDFDAAKFAVGSSLLRRSNPFRRRGSHDGVFMTGTRPDEQQSRFFLYSGQLQSIFGPYTPDSRSEYASHSFSASMVREAVGAYRVPSVILDLVFEKDLPYLQTFSGGPNYFAAQFGSDANFGRPVLGPTEIYDNEGSFLIAAGGLPEANGLPATIHGPIPAIGVFFNQGWLKSPLCNSTGATCYSGGGDDVGVTVPTVLIPYDAPASDAAGPAPIVNRSNFVQIAGTGQQDANLCVAPGFACGKNPTMPPASALVDHAANGPWQFGIVRSSPTNVFVAMLKASVNRAPATITGSTMKPPVPANFTVGLFEAEPANHFQGFGDFQGQVMRNNPLGAALIVENDGIATPWNDPTGCPGAVNGNYPPCTVTAYWSGTYKKTDGTVYNFTVAPPLDANAVWNAATDHLQLSPQVFTPYGPVPPPRPPYWDDYPIQSPNLALPAATTGVWSFAAGPVQADHSGVITITSPRFHSACRLDISDIHHPRRTGCDDLDGDQVADSADNCPVVYNPQQSNCNLDAEIASNNRSDSATTFLGDACDPVPCPLANMDATSTRTSNCYPTGVAGEQTCYSRTTRSTIQMTPIGPHPVSAILPDGATQGPFALSATEAGVTSIRFCQPSVTYGIDCTPPSQDPRADPYQFSQGQLAISTETGTDPAHPWHRITIDCQAPNTAPARIPAYALPALGASVVAATQYPVGVFNYCGGGTVVYSPTPPPGGTGNNISTGYGPNVVSNHTWCYAADFQRWQQTGAVVFDGLPTCGTDPFGTSSLGQTTPAGTCIDGTLWLSSASEIGHTVPNIGCGTVGLHPSEGRIGDFFLAARPDQPLAYCPLTSGVSGIPLGSSSNFLVARPLPQPWFLWPSLGIRRAFDIADVPATQVMLRNDYRGIVALQDNGSAVGVGNTGSGSGCDGQASASIAMTSRFQQPLVWASLAEPNAFESAGNAIQSDNHLVAIGVTADGTAAIDGAIVSGDGHMQTATELAGTSGPAYGAASAVTPPPRSGFVPVYSTAAGGLFVVGGQDSGGNPRGDIWFLPLDGAWQQLTYPAYVPGQVLAATFSFGDHKLWVLDSISNGLGFPTARLARLDAGGGQAEVVATWPRVGIFDRWFLSVDRNGAILMSGSNLVANALVRYPVDAEPIVPSVLVAQSGALLLPPVVDEYSYGFYVWNVLGQLQVVRRSLLATTGDSACTLNPVASAVADLF
jgi:hypothetical protein